MDTLTRIEKELRDRAALLRAEAAKLRKAADAIKSVAGERSRVGGRRKRARQERPRAPQRSREPVVKPAHQGRADSTRERPTTLGLGTSTKPDAPPEGTELVHTTEGGMRDG